MLVFLVALIFHLLALWRYREKAKSIPYGDESRSLEVEELLRKFDRVIKEMKKEGYQHEEL
ncbi:hypothetical protein [Thermococcus barophilus]|uniref:hypothetical protein n=1 Tax=Thermococcus barophilus TaxID=55802 RepID=UPI000AB703D5|nr:hypothetical protein [Thermococcus barophilus]